MREKPKPGGVSPAGLGEVGDRLDRNPHLQQHVHYTFNGPVTIQHVDGTGNVVGAGGNTAGGGGALVKGSGQALGAGEGSIVTTGRSTATAMPSSGTDKKIRSSGAAIFFLLVIVVASVLLATNITKVAIAAFIVGAGGLAVQAYRLLRGL